MQINLKFIVIQDSDFHPNQIKVFKRQEWRREPKVVRNLVGTYMKRRQINVAVNLENI